MERALYADLSLAMTASRVAGSSPSSMPCTLVDTAAVSNALSRDFTASPFACGQTQHNTPGEAPSAS